MISVAFGAAIALVGASIVLLVDWERLRRLCDAAFGNITVEGGWRGLRNGLCIVGTVALVVVCFFTGLVVIGQSLWGLA